LVEQTKEAEQKSKAADEEGQIEAQAEKEKIRERNFLAEEEKEIIFCRMVGTLLKTGVVFRFTFLLLGPMTSVYVVGGG
jgi:hypothetical protein